MAAAKKALMTVNKLCLQADEYGHRCKADKIAMPTKDALLDIVKQCEVIGKSLRTAIGRTPPQSTELKQQMILAAKIIAAAKPLFKNKTFFKSK